MAAVWPAIRDLIDGLANESFALGHLPTFWALAFLASLCAFLGQTVYQIGAPQSVRAHSIESFVGNRLREFDANPGLGYVIDAETAARDAFERASGRQLPSTGAGPEVAPDSWGAMVTALQRFRAAQRAGGGSRGPQSAPSRADRGQRPSRIPRSSIRSPVLGTPRTPLVHRRWGDHARHHRHADTSGAECRRDRVRRATEGFVGLPFVQLNAFPLGGVLDDESYRLEDEERWRCR